ncbi:serine/threonine-protein kinase [Porphyromonas gingivalis]|uniref:serine/threonine-protein kinase n=1 Tax=Porphyromonas gingivalis TaxID=837 RepID=UPI002659944D|nr:serine/threonine-protein kinase [Porphyromonas gingivalis]MDP0530680.1 serine/threonine-protein kinase [Porphyromonas gingivalis]MDP0625634.1 serine/threonine-protein kinase [Porphyromonas gingivalis]WKD51743.1 serine/threonine-protein kinase [Porphyromonas gingivalis]WKD53791.1 serine/threonine-protein kinase [Porphyromonas gingivalis]
MKQINITYSKGTGFDPLFDNITCISIDDTPFAGGGFGDIYYARGFNGNNQSKLRQVIKVFKPSTIGKEEHSWKTIVRLQEKLMEEIELCVDNGQNFLDQYPALVAMPQFVFEGTLDGKMIRGYSTNNLNDLGYISFDKVIDEEDSSYIEVFENKNMEWRFTMAYHLVRGFNLLYKIHFLHADISSDNIFVSLTHPTCAILDFDSGAIVETTEDNPSTFGKFQPWLAPEVSFQLKKRKAAGGNMLVDINSFTDAWSVANALLNMLVLMPAYYLVDMSENSLKAYVTKYIWPEAHFSDSIFEIGNKEGYDYFYEVYTKMLPEEVQKEFVATFSKGVFKPSLRTSYNRWERIIRSQIPKSAWRISIPIPDSPTSSYSCVPDSPSNTNELEEYINALVVDVINGDENLNRHTNFLNAMAIKAKLDGRKVMEELKDFIDLYTDCINDGVISKFEKSNLFAQGEMALVTKETIDKLLSPYEKV